MAHGHHNRDAGHDERLTTMHSSIQGGLRGWLRKPRFRSPRRLWAVPNLAPLLAIIACGCLNVATHGYAQDNLVTNPSFEYGLAGYHHYVWTGQVQLRVVSEGAHSGTNCLEIAGTNAAVTVWQNYPVPTNREATVSLWVQPRGVSGPGITGLEIQSSGHFYYVSPDQETNPCQWRQLSVSFNTGDATNVTVICSFEMSATGTGAARFDDLSLAVQGITLPPPMSLTTSNNISGKPSFYLNGEPFCPVVLTATWPPPNTTQLRDLKREGVNMILLSTHAASAWNASVWEFLRDCRSAGMPVLLELFTSMWDGWLQAVPERNLQLGTNYPGTNRFVQHYPDFSKSEVTSYVSNEIRTLVAAVQPFHHSPVVAYSINAYDLYHLPDGEIHVWWETALHNGPDGHETWLPYGAHITADFRTFLASNGINPLSLGFPSVSSVTTPTSLAAAGNEEHWRWWLLYRRFFVRRYVSFVIGCFKQHCDLPVTGSFDLNFSLLEQYATPMTSLSDVYDFTMLYWYDYGKRPPDNTVVPLLETVQAELAFRGRSALALMNLIQTVPLSPGPNNKPVEMDFGLPYVGGFFSWDVGYSPDFLAHASAFTRDGLWQHQPRVANTAILVSSLDVANVERGFLTGLFLSERGIPYDIIYRKEQLSSYRETYILPDQPAFAADPAAQQAMQSFVASGGRVLGSLYVLFASPFTAFDFEESSGVHASWVAGSGTGTLSVSQDTTRSRHGQGSLRWSYQLPSSPAGNYPMFDLATLEHNLSGLKKIGLWCYLDCAGAKTGRMLALDLIRFQAGQPATMLGDWNVGAAGIPSGQWVWHEWAVPTGEDLTNVDFIRLRYDAGDGWQSIAQNGTNVTFYLDDIAFFFERAGGEVDLEASVSSNGNQMVLSWPAHASLFTLQSSASLNDPVAWSAVTNAATWNNRRMHMSVPATGDQRFFRLCYP